MEPPSSGIGLPSPAPPAAITQSEAAGALKQAVAPDGGSEDSYELEVESDEGLEGIEIVDEEEDYAFAPHQVEFAIDMNSIFLGKQHQITLFSKQAPSARSDSNCFPLQAKSRSVSGGGLSASPPLAPQGSRSGGGGAAGESRELDDSGLSSSSLMLQGGRIR